MNYPSERFVSFLGIFNDSAFLQQFTGGEMQFCGKIFIYDTRNRSVSEPNFTKPLHVNVNCADGILDIICESVTESP